MATTTSQNLLSVFTAFSALTVPVTPAQAKTLSNNVAQVQNWNNRQTLALSVLALAYKLNHAGGTDYRTNLKQLVIDATSFMGVFEVVNADREPGGPLDDFEAVCDWNAAYNVDTTIGTNINTILGNISFLQDTPQATLRLYIVFLRYAGSIKGV